MPGKSTTIRPFKQLAFFLLTGLLFQNCGSLKPIGKQKLQPGMAWEINMKTSAKLFPGATKEEKRHAKKINAGRDSLKSQILRDDSHLLRSVYGAYSYQELVDTKNSVIMTRLDGKVTRISLDKADARQRKDSVGRLVNLKLYPDSVKTIFGFRCHKATYQMPIGHQIHVTVWYTRNLPAIDPIKKQANQVPGVVLESCLTTEHLRVITKTSSIRQIPVTDSTFVLLPDNPSEPDAYYGTWSSENILNKKNLKYKKKLLKKLKSTRHQQAFDKGAVVKYGFILLKKGDSVFYVNENGAYAFDKILSVYHPIGKAKAAGPGWVTLDKADSIMMLVVEKKGKIGLIQSDSGWVLPAKYDNLHIDFKRYLALHRGGKMGYADTRGHMLVPVKFDKVNILDSNYFDVQAGDKWSIYSRRQKKLILPAVFDKFDFCGGCGGKVDYAYASKNGKWGVIDFQGKVLLPFAFEHPGHYNMRSDEWVAGFTQNGKNVIVNLNTQKIYSEVDYEDMEIISGVLALKKEGKYGLIGSNGQQLLPFEYDDMGNPYTHFQWGPLIQIYKNGKCGMADNEGHILIPPGKYKRIYAEDNFFGAYINDSNVVVLDQSGQQITPPGYRVDNWRYPMEALDSSNRLNRIFIIQKGEKEGFYNAQTGDLVKPRFSSVYLLRPGDSLRSYVRVKNKDGRYGLYSIYGQRLAPARYAGFDFLGNGIIETRRNGKYGLYDLKNAGEVVPVKYDYITRIDRRFVLLKKSDSCCKEAKIYDATKKKIFSLPYDEVNPAGEGMLLVNDTVNTYLFSLKKEKIVSKGYPIHRYGKYAYEGIDFGLHGLFKVSCRGKTGYINKTGKEIIPVKYDRVSMNKQGIIQLENEPEHNLLTYQYVDSSGRFLSDSVFSYKEGYHYDYPYRFQQGKYLVISRYDANTNQNLFGMMTLKGQIIVPPKYTKVFPSENDNGFMVECYDRWGLLDKNGKAVIPAVLDNIYTSPGVSEEKKDLRFPVLCKLAGMYFYVKKNGGILPFETNGVLHYANRW